MQQLRSLRVSKFKEERSNGPFSIIENSHDKMYIVLKNIFVLENTYFTIFYFIFYLSLIVCLILSLI